jgi:protein-tyrosine phosphatase
LDEIVKNLYLGDYQDALSLGPTVPRGWSILAVTEYLNETPNEPKGAKISPFMGFPPKSDEARMDVLAENAQWISRQLAVSDKVLVHCSHGHERSPLQIVWYLHGYRGMTLDDAYNLVIKKHPTAVRRLYWIPQQYRPFVFDGKTGA